MDAMHPLARSQPNHHKSVHLIYRCWARRSLYIDTNLFIYPQGESYTRARARTWARVAMHMRAYVRHATRVIRAKTTIYKYTHMAIYRLGSDTEGAPGAECMQRAAESAA
jgi:hypothetical protein